MHTVKRNDLRTIRWDLGRDLSAVTSARVLIAAYAGEEPRIDLASDSSTQVEIEDAVGGIVAFTFVATDFADGALDPGTYFVEVETEPGPLTHPEDGYERLTIVEDLG